MRDSSFVSGLASPLAAELGWKLRCCSLPEDAGDVQPEEGVRMPPNEVVVQAILSAEQ